MPELPEVETIVRGLKTKVLRRTFVDVWTDFKKTIRLRSDLGGQVKKSDSFKVFKKRIKGKKILDIRRRGKNIIFDLSDGLSLLIHQKLTGHLLYGNWNMKQGKWLAGEKGWLEDPVNRFIHLMFWLDNGRMLALSDLRKFAKVELWDKEELRTSEEMKSLGPEPLERDFTFEKFKETLRQGHSAELSRSPQGKPRKGKIKQVLMNQKVIAGIGNIYSDEILWEAKIHPFKEINGLNAGEIRKVYGAVKKILNRAIELKGDSMSDYRLITGEKGGYQKFQKVYQQEGKPCKRLDGGIIKRVKIGGRSARFCPVCQKM